MSIPKKMTVKCSKCGAEIDVTVFESVNTDFAEDIIEQITSGDLFNAKCDKCGFVSHLEYDILYHDVKHGAMVWVLHNNSPEYSNRVAELRSSPNILKYKTTRIVNNMNELRQKVACLENGRDDRIIELCKVFIAYNLLSKQPDFDFHNAFYTNFLDQERVFLYDKNGQELSCELMNDIYSMLSEMYYSSEYATTFEDYYALVDYDWAESILQPLLKRESDRIDAKNATQSTTNNNTNTAEKRAVCPQCKKELPQDSEFCQYCGSKIIVNGSTNSYSSDRNNYTTNTAISESTVLNNTANESSNHRGKEILSKRNKIILLILGVVIVLAILIIALIIPQYKYSYVLEHKNNYNLTTYEYLKDLKKRDYKDSANIYEELYGWEVTVVAVNSSETDETTRKNQISKYDPVYFHIKLSGGAPNAKMRITVKSTLPNGVSDEYMFDDKWEDGEYGWYGWYDGIYEYPEYGSNGTLQCKFYDEEGNLIGIGSVRITD